ncbi:uncharacterized protein LOC135146428 [Zophobas morio]|uniref:uncharacterized protein LOC135146428 n=1 Tax=Zophobas morio TaxID=2755281 RepID=UPI00308347BF
MREEYKTQMTSFECIKSNLLEKNRDLQTRVSFLEKELKNIQAEKSCANLSYQDCLIATNNFSTENLIGKGGFGSVFRGTLKGTEVAIKILSPESSQGLAEFSREIQILGKCRHRNLVSLTGICKEDNKLCLIYEYMPHGSLRDRLDCRHSTPPLEWNTRVQIALESARGLLYLHCGITPPVLHLDVKSMNILLDKNFVAKVADFGLIRPTPEATGRTHVTTKRLSGTHGYICPEYASTGRITNRADVYSFGVVLLELITGFPAVLPEFTPPQLCLRVKDYLKGNATWFRHPKDNTVPFKSVNSAQKKWPTETSLQELLDPNAQNWPIAKAKLIIKLALECVKPRPSRRPSMAEVFKRLEEVQKSTKQKCQVLRH